MLTVCKEFKELMDIAGIKKVSINSGIHDITIEHVNEEEVYISLNNNSTIYNIESITREYIDSPNSQKDCLIQEFYKKYYPDEDSIIKIWPSNKIPYAYLETNYAKTCGVLGSSCMRYKNMQKAMQFYVKNNVKIAVIATKNNKILARALLWEDVKRDKITVTYLDRCYYSNERYRAAYKRFAIKNSYSYHNNTGDSKLYIDVNIEGITHLPYTDTFRFLHRKKGILANYESKTEKVIPLTHTQNYGYYPQLDPNSVEEVFSGHYISKKDSIFVKRYKGYVAKSHIVDISGAYYSSYDNNTILELATGWCLVENVIEEIITKHKIDKAKAIFLSKYDGYVACSNIAIIGNIKYHKKDPDIVYLDGNWCLKSKCYKTYQGAFIPKDKTVIAYNLIQEGEDILFDNGHYAYEKDGFFILHSGEYIIKTSDNRGLIKSRNKKFYLADRVPQINKNQLLLFK